MTEHTEKQLLARIKELEAQVAELDEQAFAESERADRAVAELAYLRSVRWAARRFHKGKAVPGE